MIPPSKDYLGIHEELDRVILRERFVLWARRRFRMHERDPTPAQVRKICRGSDRLSVAKPMFEERNPYQGEE